MSEIPRPVTWAFNIHEEYSLPSVEEKILAFEETGKPTEVWHDSWDEDTAGNRRLTLTNYEREQAMLQVLALCGISSDFHKHIRLLHKHTGLDDDIWAQESTFGDSTPPLASIFQWLADLDSIHRDEANDFTVGLAMDSPLGLVVVKYRSEEPFIDDDSLETVYQISLYPKDKINEIWWHTSKYDRRA